MTIPEALKRVPIARLEQRLESEPTTDASLSHYLGLFAARQDSPDELLHLATSTTNHHAAGAALLRGILRSAEQGAPIHPRVDKLFAFKKCVQESWVLTTRWDGLDETIAAVKTLGTDRGLALTEHLLTGDPTFGLGCLLLHLFPDATQLADKVLERLRTWPYPSSEVSMGFSLFPLSLLRYRLEQLNGLEPDSNGANLVRLGIQRAFMRAAERSELWDESLDRQLSVHSVWLDNDFMFANYAAPVLRAALHALPGERARTWLDLQLDPSRTTFARVLLVIPLRDHGLASSALGFCAANPKAVRKPAWEWLTQLARDLGPLAAAHLQALPKGKVRTSFEAGCCAASQEPSTQPAQNGADTEHKPETKARAARTRQPSAAVQKLQRLAAKASAATSPTSLTPISILEAVRGAKDLGISRIGGPGYDLGERHPTFETLPMTHVFTIAVDDIPALRGAFDGPVAFALYIAEPGGQQAGEPYTDEAVVLALGAEDLTRGLAQPGAVDLPVAGIRCTTVDVPVDSIGSDSATHLELNRAIRSLPCRAGGSPAWLQQDADSEGFLLQFDARFAPLNLGDSGVLYVFRDTAFAQSL